MTHTTYTPSSAWKYHSRTHTHTHNTALSKTIAPGNWGILSRNKAKMKSGQWVLPTAILAHTLSWVEENHWHLIFNLLFGDAHASFHKYDDDTWSYDKHLKGLVAADSCRQSHLLSFFLKCLYTVIPVYVLLRGHFLRIHCKCDKLHTVYWVTNSWQNQGNWVNKYSL